MSEQLLQECMSYFKDTLCEYMIVEFKRVFGETWIESALNPPGKDALMIVKKNPKDWDIHILTNLIHSHWDQVFCKPICDKFPKALFTVVKFYRNNWAHQHKMTDRDIYRVIDILELILSSLGLNSQPIEAKRLEILIRLTSNTNVYQNSQPKFVCAGCHNFFFLDNKFECFTCGILSCIFCLAHWAQNNGKICPQCKRVLNLQEINSISSRFDTIYQPN